MGGVSRARTRLERLVAIKFLDRPAGRSGGTPRPGSPARLLLNHPGIVTVFDIGRFEGRP
jgi:hypothetical protein